MNKQKKQKQAEIIMKAITPRLVECFKRIENNSINDAYIAAFKIGLLEDIKEGIIQ